MADFWLEQTRTHACKFLADSRDLTLGDYRNWRAIWHFGQHFLADNDIIYIIPLDAAFDEAQLILRSPNQAAKLNIRLRCVIPNFVGAEPKIHYMVGDGGNNDLIYVYKLDTSGGGPSILLQRFDNNGSHRAQEPDSANVVKYQPPSAPGQMQGNVVSTPTEVIIATQDDEGSGDPPLP